MRRRIQALQHQRAIIDWLRVFWLIVAITISAAFLGKSLAAQDSALTGAFVAVLEQAPLVNVKEEVGDTDTRTSSLQNADARMIAINVRGRILDDNGIPIADAVVVISQASGVRARTRSNAAGEYQFDRVLCALADSSPTDRTKLAKIVAADDRGRLNWKAIQYYEPSHIKFLGPFKFLNNDPLSDSFTDSISRQQNVSLGQSHALTGIVMDPDNQPVADVVLELPGLMKATSKGSSNIHNFDIWRLSGSQKLQAKTDAKGEFRFPDMPGGMIAFLLMKHPDFYQSVAHVGTSPDVTALPTGRHIDASEPIAHSPARLHMTEGVRLQCRIVNQDNVPLPGADIQNHVTHRSEATSDAEGNFTFSVPSERLSKQGDGDTVLLFDVVWPDDAPYANETPSLSRKQILDGEVLTIVAENAIEIRGQVIASDDQSPVADLPLRIQSWQSQPRSFVETQTDIDGQFTAKASIGQWLVTCGPKAGFDLSPSPAGSGRQRSLDPKSQRIVDVVEPNQPIELGIIIDRMPSVDVHVVDSDGQPVEEAKVSFWRGSQGGWRQPARRTSAPSIVPDGITDDRGVCKFHVPTLQDENWVVRVCSPADTPRLFALKVIESRRNQPMKIKLTEGVPVQGRVLLDGAPLANIQVRLSAGPYQTGTANSSDWISTVSSNAEGEYTLYLPPSNAGSGPEFASLYRLALVGIPEFTQGLRPVHTVSNRTSRNTTEGAIEVKDFIVTSASGEASGRVIDESGAPIAGATVRVNPNAPLLGAPEKQAYAITDEQGAFRWRGLGSNKYRPIIIINGKPISPEVVIQAGQDSIEIVVGENE